MMRRRMAQMNARMNPGMMSQPSGPSNTPAPSKGGANSGPQYNTGMTNSVAQPGKPGMSGQPNPNNQAVLDAVKKVIFVIINYLPKLRILVQRRSRRRPRCRRSGSRE